MKLTKFVHSCVLVELPERVALFDPGAYSWQSGLIKLDQLPEIHDVIITHEHPDHYDEEFIKGIHSHSPNAQYITNSSIAQKLKMLGLSNITTDSTTSTFVKPWKHERVEPFGETPAHIGVDWMNLLTHPGDTHAFNETKQTLFLPITAPWGTTIRAIELGLALKPKNILPIHDWMLNDQWRGVVYERVEPLFANAGIKFLKPVNGVTIEL